MQFEGAQLRRSQPAFIIFMVMKLVSVQVDIIFILNLYNLNVNQCYADPFRAYMILDIERCNLSIFNVSIALCIDIQ
jgi:hypothetical protein